MRIFPSQCLWLSCNDLRCCQDIKLQQPTNIIPNQHTSCASIWYRYSGHSLRGNLGNAPAPLRVCTSLTTATLLTLPLQAEPHDVTSLGPLEVHGCMVLNGFMVLQTDMLWLPGRWFIPLNHIARKHCITATNSSTLQFSYLNVVCFVAALLLKGLAFVLHCQTLILLLFLTSWYYDIIIR